MADEITLTEEQKALIERLGVYHEKVGIPPAPSRILSLLTISPETELTFDQIRSTLQLSKSATSNALNMLMNTEKVDYITRSGDRKRYFKSKIGVWRKEMTSTVNRLTKAADLLEEVLHNRPKETVEFNKNLENVIDFMRFINAEMPELIKKWEAKQE